VDDKQLLFNAGKLNEMKDVEDKMNQFSSATAELSRQKDQDGIESTNSTRSCLLSNHRPAKFFAQLIAPSTLSNAA